MKNRVRYSQEIDVMSTEDMNEEIIDCSESERYMYEKTKRQERYQIKKQKKNNRNKRSRFDDDFDY